jgi:hypothetical protein
MPARKPARAARCRAFAAHSARNWSLVAGHERRSSAGCCYYVVIESWYSRVWWPPSSTLLTADSRLKAIFGRRSSIVNPLADYFTTIDAVVGMRGSGAVGDSGQRLAGQRIGALVVALLGGYISPLTEHFGKPAVRTVFA